MNAEAALVCVYLGGTNHYMQCYSIIVVTDTATVDLSWKLNKVGNTTHVERYTESTSMSCRVLYYSQPGHTHYSLFIVLP